MLIFSLLACGGPDLPQQQATWLSGFYYRWEFFNHRVSHLTVGVADDQARVSVVGGTSTTSEIPEPLPDECDRESCNEFPIFDNAEVRIGWGSISTDQVALGTGTGTLEVGRDGGSTTISVEVPEGAKGEATALLRGLTFDTDHELSGGPACYRPRYGWHPRRIHAEIVSAELVDGAVEVEVAASFEAGATLDPDRVCIDDVHDQAIVDVVVEVLAIVGDGAVEDKPVKAAMEYPFNGDQFEPEEQAEVAPKALSWSLDAPVVGWAAVDFRFKEDDPDLRGVYLRSFGFELTDAGASGVATNYSPGTQLEDLSYAFAGTARAVEVEGQIDGGTVAQKIPVELDDVSGEPVVYELDF